MPVLALSLHAGFACRRSGACCTAGWPIPVEPATAAAIRAAMPDAVGALQPAGMLPDGSAAVIAPRSDGACPFFVREAGSRCAVQGCLGHDGLPASCRHFPRVSLIEADAVRVTLSHFCPTAASMLFAETDAAPAIVGDAAGIADRREHSGFDAQSTIPPLLRPGVAMDEASCRHWESFLLRTLGGPSRAAIEDSLGDVLTAAEQLRDWRPEQGALASRADELLTGRRTEACAARRMSLESARRLFTLASDAVPAGLAAPAAPAGADEADDRWVRPRWAQVRRVLGRYLAARSFGAWSAYLGEGIRTQAAMLAVALAAARLEAVRQTARARRPLDDGLLLEAIRAADLLLHHLSDTRALVRSLAWVERGSLAAILTRLGLQEAR